MIEQVNGGLMPPSEPGTGVHPHVGVTYKISVWESHAASVDPRAKPISEQIIRNHMTYEGLNYLNFCGFAPNGSAWAMNGSTSSSYGTFGMYVGLVNGAYSSSVSNYLDAAVTIRTTAPSGTPGTTPNYWSELTNFQTPTTGRQVAGLYTYSGSSGSGGLIQVVTTGTAPSFTGGTGGGNVMGAFMVVGSTTGSFGNSVTAYGASGAASPYNGGAAYAQSLISVAIGSIQAFSAGQIITVAVTISFQSA